MTNTMTNNIWTLKTGIKKADFDQLVGSAILNDEEGNMLYAVGMVAESKADGSISEKMLNCNAVIDGELALTTVLPRNKSVDEVIRENYKAIVNAEKYLPHVAELVTKEAGVVSRIKAEMTAE